jgi:hypothetical protein
MTQRILRDDGCAWDAHHRIDHASFDLRPSRIVIVAVISSLGTAKSLLSSLMSMLTGGSVS